MTEHPAVSRFREYLRIKTVQPNPDYEGCTAFLKRQAEEIGLGFKVVECAPGKPNVILTWEGADASLPTLLLNSHTDVVPVFPEQWTYDPFEAKKTENGDIYARGAQDMKCVGSSYLEAIRQLKANGFKPLRTIHLSFVAEEEVAGQLGMKLLCETDDFKALNVGFALDEGIACPHKALKVFYGERAPWWVKITAKGPVGHGSQFIQDVATIKLVKVLRKFIEFREEQEKQLEIGVHDDGRAFTLGDVTTVNLTMLEAGVQYNVVPNEASAGLDIRVSPSFDLKEFEQRIRGWVAQEKDVHLEFIAYFGDNSTTNLTDDNVWWRVVKETANKHSLPLEPEIFPAATDSRFLRAQGIPALGISYLKNIPVLLHDHDERLNENEFIEGIGFYVDLIERLSMLQHDIDTNTDKIRSKLGSIRGNLDGVAKGSPTSAYTAPQQYTPAIPHITQTTTYISDRLVPEVKSTWNDHVMAAARSLNRLNLWEDASQLLTLLEDAVKATNNEYQQMVQEKLDSFHKIPDYNSYLAYILTQQTDQQPATRMIAGLLLKNNIRMRLPEIPAPVLEYVKTSMLTSLGEPDQNVRATIGTVISTIVSRGGVAAWPQVLPALTECLDNPNEAVVEGAFGALSKICEDSSRELDQDIEGVRPLNFMIPKFIQFCDSPSNKIRVYALSCINQFILLRSVSLMVNIDAFVNALFARATDQHEDVRRHVCQALVMLLEVRADKLLPQMNNVVEYMLYSTQDDDERVALEACEFWLAFAEQDELHDALLPFLPRIIPVLLKGMVYSDIDIMTLGGDEDDAAVPDSDQDIKPRHHRAKTVSHERTEADGAQGQAQPKAADDDEDEGEDDYDDDDDDDDLYSEWNLRKCSAAALDVLATVFTDRLLEILLPHLKDQLWSQDWKTREAGILALGAVAEGCMKGIEPHLPTLIPFLMQNLKDSKPLVRSITCWTLGRYSRWCVEQSATPERRKSYFEPLMEGLLAMVLDNNKRVQEAGCSAFATFEEEAELTLVPYLQPILGHLNQAFAKYQHKNLLILYDAVGTLADSVGNALNQPELIKILMPPLIAKWDALPDDDTDLFPLLECLSSVTSALGQGFVPFAAPVFSRCVKLVHNTLVAARMHAENNTLDIPDKDFMIVSLDLLSGLVQGLGPSSESLIASSQPPLVPLLLASMTDPVPEVRQSTFALFGDMTISCFGHVKPCLPQLLPELLNQIEPQAEHVSVCNNAAWTAGEIALQWGAEIQPWVQPFLQRLIPLLNNEHTPRTLAENAAITIGRLGLVCPDVVAPHLEHFVEMWCKSLRTIRDNEEKASAFKGLCEMVGRNPQGAVKSFFWFCDAIAQWQQPDAQLNEIFGNVLTAYKNMFGPNWESATSSSADATVRCWDGATGEPTHVLTDHKMGVISVDVDRQGTTLATSSIDAQIHVYDLTNEPTLKQTVNSVPTEAWTIKLSPEGDLVASGAHNGNLNLYSVASGEKVQSLATRKRFLMSVAYSHDGHYVAGGADNGTIYIFNTETGQLVHTMSGHALPTRALVFSPDSKTLISGSDDKRIHIHDIQHGNIAASLSGHASWVLSVDTPREASGLAINQIASGSSDKKCKIWDLGMRTCLETMDAHEDQVWAVAYNPNGTKIVTASDDKSLRWYSSGA
ncbi:hypothetical protein BZG36_04519 [Bifiguratus adelaidae]|uniref:N-acyl-aliphatic-L-amino acid amidohydrolase n=1 Tax=Bifiguratus adelaidae TaxID=1938954 RepID=A0A261XX66_9FUNG|nr:hypothetical protein BZG36_04519 [Bifiguratus adelaidae]